jgi:hypothetical protein
MKAGRREVLGSFPGTASRRDQGRRTAASDPRGPSADLLAAHGDFGRTSGKFNVAVLRNGWRRLSYTPHHPFPPSCSFSIRPQTRSRIRRDDAPHTERPKPSRILVSPCSFATTGRGQIPESESMAMRKPRLARRYSPPWNSVQAISQSPFIGSTRCAKKTELTGSTRDTPYWNKIDFGPRRRAGRVSVQPSLEMVAGTANQA